jgi:hypothetical protein
MTAGFFYCNCAYILRNFQIRSNEIVDIIYRTHPCLFLLKAIEGNPNALKPLLSVDVHIMTDPFPLNFFS